MKEPSLVMLGRLHVILVQCPTASPQDLDQAPDIGPTGDEKSSAKREILQRYR